MGTFYIVAATAVLVLGLVAFSNLQRVMQAPSSARRSDLSSLRLDLDEMPTLPPQEPKTPFWRRFTFKDFMPGNAGRDGGHSTLVELNANAVADGWVEDLPVSTPPPASARVAYSPASSAPPAPAASAAASRAATAPTAQASAADTPAKEGPAPSYPAASPRVARGAAASARVAPEPRGAVKDQPVAAQKTSSKSRIPRIIQVVLIGFAVVVLVRKQRQNAKNRVPHAPRRQVA